MSDADRDERTEEATGRRLDRERSKGNVPYSKEISAAALLIAFVAVLRAAGADLVTALADSYRAALSLRAASRVVDGGLSGLALEIAAPALLPAAAGLFASGVVAAAAGFFQVGFSIESERLGLKFERLNPVAGFGRLFGAQSWAALGSGLLKIVVVSKLAYDALSDAARDLALAPAASLAEAAAATLDAALVFAARVGVFLVVYAGAHVLWRRFAYKRDLRMTKQEVKDEHKQDEGDPAAKAEIKRRMRELARRKMMNDVKKADFVVRNPTHFAVALRYDRKLEHAPRVLAKGADALALRIIAEAEKRGVPVISKPEVARELYRTVRVGEQIPPALYKAAAALLAFVSRKKRRAA
jgi:flagellar biosynthetic protein FlhB